MRRLNTCPQIYFRECVLGILSKLNVTMTMSNSYAVFAMLKLMNCGNGDGTKT